MTIGLSVRDIMVKGVMFSLLLCSSLALGLMSTAYSPEVTAAPAVPPGGGPVCPPACPPNPTNCDANLVITAAQNLQFGSMAAPLAGTVIVDTTGVRVATGGVVLIGAGGAAASFSMSTAPYTCTNRAVVTVTVGPNATLTHTTMPANTMAVGTFTTSLIPGDLFASLLTVGATLNVGTLQTSGSYSGTFLVTVTFQ